MKTAGKPVDAFNDVASSAHKTIDRASDAINPVLESANSYAHNTVDKAFKAATPAAQWLQQRRSDLQNLPDRGGEYISANPIKAVGLALLAGAILARILL